MSARGTTPCPSCGSDDTYRTSLGTVRCNACGEHRETREAIAKTYADLRERNAEAKRLRAEGWTVEVRATRDPFTWERLYLLDAYRGTDRAPDLSVSDANGTRLGWTTREDEDR